MTNIKIFYVCDVIDFLPGDRKRIAGGNVTFDDIDKYHELVYEFDIDEVVQSNVLLKEILKLFSSEVNPLYADEYLDTISEFTHINMAVGDIICINNIYHIVQSSGFYTLLPQ